MPAEASSQSLPKASGVRHLPLLSWTDVDIQTQKWRDKELEKIHNNNNNNNSYTALNPVKHYELAELYIINIKIHLTIKKAQVL